MEHNTTVKVLIAGFGDLGAEVARQLLKSGIKVIGLRRNIAIINAENADPDLQMIAADLTQEASAKLLEAVEPEIIVYCVAADSQTDEAYQAAYVKGLRNVLSSQRHNSRLRHIFFVSSTRVYGQDADAILDENTPAMPADFGGERLLEGEGLLRMLTCGVTVLRLSGIYGPGRLRMLNLAKSPDNWPKQNIWSNRIHRDDAAAFMVFLIWQVLAGHTIKNCYIVTDSKPTPQHEVLSWLAAQMQLPQSRLLPVTGGKRLSNQAMLASGFKLQYPDYETGYRTLLQNDTP